MLIIVFHELPTPEHITQGLNKPIERIGDLPVPHPLRQHTQLHQFLQLRTVQDDLGGVPHESHVHAEEVFGEVGVLLEFLELAEVQEGQFAGVGVDRG